MTTLLIILLIVIWGTVIYRLFSGASTSTEQNMSSVFVPVNSSGSSIIDTFDLIANYRDPFLGRIITDHHGNRYSQGKKEPPIATTPPVPIRFPVVAYSGMIKNKKTGILYAMLSVDNQSQVMKIGDKVMELELVRIFRDSVEVKFDKGKKMICLNKR